MPVIEGLAEQKEALSRIKENLKDIEKLNVALVSIKKLSEDPAVTQQKQIVELTFVLNEGSLKREKIPVEDLDISLIFTAAQNYKKTVADNVKADSVKYRISLSQQEKAMLEEEIILEK